ncbi:glycosyltransferase family 4 protein [Pontibacter toksunensis]|uniref:Glycosyltransferase family 4 protein n=1 Tax=Pontibacter toksunensis TaxID=1332631 RepID=A0ABW6BPQ9_9BACT
MKVIFTYLTSFLGHGGIEKFNKSFIRAVDAHIDEISLEVISAYDTSSDSNYIKEAAFRGYRGKRASYIFGILKKIFSADVLIIGHINLAIVGLAAKMINPNIKLILITHGIDVWYDLSWAKKKLLNSTDVILSVSSFTKQKLMTKHQIIGTKIILFPNTLDPFFFFPTEFLKPAYLLQRYHIFDRQPVILSLCRLSSKEGYKGYDTVIKALPLVIAVYPDIKYVIVGKYDQQEYERVTMLAKQVGVFDNLLLTGFVPDEELTDHYLLSDLFVMPSREEGFGIVYIEAMACGLPVVAGNVDGSVDALDHGNLGTLVDPTDHDAIATAILQNLAHKMNHEEKIDLQRRVISKFGFSKFTARLTDIIKELKEREHVRH